MTDQLPSTWALATLEQLLAPLEDGRLLHHGWSPQCEKEPAGSDEEWGVLKTTAIQPGAFLPEHNKKLPSGLSPRPQHEVKVGDLLITCAGPRVRCGIPCLVKSTRPKLMLSGKIYRFRVPDDFVDSAYIEKYLLSQKAQRAIDAMKTGGSDSGLNLTHDRFKPLPVPLAPINEQRRIASKIDELFSRIDEGDRALERVSMLVERYRQSVLKAAIAGELTREWREKNKDRLESGEALLARIRTARREAWENAELAKMKAKGITPANEKWKQKYEEPSRPDMSGLPELPAGWVWATVGQLCFVDTGATPKRGTARYFEGGTIPWITSSAVNSLRITVAAELITPAAIEETNAKVFPAGSFIVAMYGEGKTRGKIAELGINAATNQACAALVCGHLDSPVRSLIRSFFEKNYEVLRTQAAGGVQPNLNLSILKQTVIALPPIREIEEINERVAEMQSPVAAVAEEFESWSRRSAGLRQAILRSAFFGELVGQDPSDEPASVLLERIAAERGANAAAPKRGRKNKVPA